MSTTLWYAWDSPWSRFDGPDDHNALSPEDAVAALVDGRAVVGVRTDHPDWEDLDDSIEGEIQEQLDPLYCDWWYAEGVVWGTQLWEHPTNLENNLWEAAWTAVSRWLDKHGTPEEQHLFDVLSESDEQWPDELLSIVRGICAPGDATTPSET